MEIKAIVVHHTGVIQNLSDDAIVRGIREYTAARYNGKFPNEYHYIIGKTGKLYKEADHNTVLPHCGRDEYVEEDRWPTGVYNQNSLAVCVIGNMSVQTMPQAQYNILIKTLKELKKQYMRAWILLHREIARTECPGSKFPAAKMLADIKGPIPTPDPIIKPVPWYKPAVDFVIQEGYMTGGTPAEGFEPERALTRAEMAQILYNLSKKGVIR